MGNIKIKDLTPIAAAKAQRKTEAKGEKQVSCLFLNFSHFKL